MLKVGIEDGQAAVILEKEIPESDHARVIIAARNYSREMTAASKEEVRDAAK